jgi:hypothetical protein
VAVFFFLLTSVVLSVIFFINYEHGREQQEVDKNLVSNVSRVLETVANGGSPSDAKIQPTGSSDLDAVLTKVIQLTSQVYGLLDGMEAEINALHQESVFADFVLTNKTKLASETQKRLAGQAIIEKYQNSLAPTVEAARNEIASLNVSESVKRGALAGFDKSIKKQAPRMEEMFKVRIRREKAEAGFLQFMLNAFTRYKLDGKSISFSLSEHLQAYKKLAQEISLAEAAGKAFQEQQLEEMDAAKTKLQEIAK